MTEGDRVELRRLQAKVLDLVQECDLPPDKKTEIIASVRGWDS